MNNLYVAIDEDRDGHEWIVGVFPSLSLLQNTVEYTDYKVINLDYIDAGFYIDKEGDINKIR